MQFSDEKTQQKIDELRRKEEEESVKILAGKYKIPYLDLSTFPVETEALKLVTEEKARNAGLAVIQMTGRKLKVIVRNPDRDETRAILNKLEDGGYEYDTHLVSIHSLERAWEYYKKVIAEVLTETGSVSVREEKIAGFSVEIKNLQNVGNLIEKISAGNTTEMLEVIIAGALSLGASDIHIETQKDLARLRYRLDGNLQDAGNLQSKMYNLLLSRIKLISDLKLNVHTKAQDGRFTIKTKEAEIEVRTSALPGPYGENLVLRILDPRNLGVGFDNLGMQPWVAEMVEKELKRPNGMILTTGPTGSGKTTTLYAFLKKIHTPDIKIITLEDPIEYHLEGVEQTQIDSAAGYDFASGLRASLRQDPDVILVGEIRDQETAETAMHAALTGHLVFSTLHTNNAAATIPRLLDLEIKPAVIAPALNMAIAQRLVRKICASCKVESKLSAEDRQLIQKEIDDMPEKITKPKPESWTVFESNKAGCEKCFQGYKGRLGVYEIILIDEKIEELIMKSPSEFEIKKAAREQGQITIRQDGVLKIVSGLTDLVELDRVVGAE